MTERIDSYDNFTRYLDEVGFMPLSNNPLGYPNLAALTPQGQWHTGLDTDPWRWKSRIVEERRAAYAKIFHGLPSFISKEWYPLFLAVRRGGSSFEEAWERGAMSAEARRIYGLFDDRRVLAVHEIKQLGGFTRASKGKYETAMTALQAGMFLTVSGMTRMATLDGRPHSWPVTEYMRVEDWVWEGTMEQAGKIGRQEAAERIYQRINELLPGADRAKANKFIGYDIGSSL